MKDLAYQSPTLVYILIFSLSSVAHINNMERRILKTSETTTQTEGL